MSGLQRLLIVLIVLVIISLGSALWLLSPHKMPDSPVSNAVNARSTDANATETAAVPDDPYFHDTLADGAAGPELARIPAGEFQMGSPKNEPGRYDNEATRQVVIDQAFAIGRYEVTFDEYMQFARATDREIPDDHDWGYGQQPVINISFRDALAYTGWLSQQTGHEYRLPTEAEWEYAARGGTQTAYWWGKQFNPAMLNCYGCNPSQEISAPTPVGQFPANPFGLYDVLGNVWEWTCSNYSEQYDGQQLRCAPAHDKSNKAIRGASYQNRPEVEARFSMNGEVFHPLRVAVRDKIHPDDENDILGFRVVRELR